MGLRIKALAFSALAIVFFAISFFVSTNEKKLTIWTGYHVLLVESRAPEIEIIELLESSGISSLISESTQPLLISNFSSLIRISLREADKRLIEDDPRKDSYIDSLRSWFAAWIDGVPYRIFYLKKGITPLPTMYRDRLQERGFSFLEPSKNVTGQFARSGINNYSIFEFFTFSMELGIATFLVFSSRRGRRLRTLLTLPWLGLASLGIESAAPLCIGMALFVAVERLAADTIAETGHSRVFRGKTIFIFFIRSVPVPVLVVAFVLVLLLDITQTPRILLTVGSIIFGLVALKARIHHLSQTQKKMNGIARRPFVPIKIDTRIPLEKSYVRGGNRLFCLIAMIGVFCSLTARLLPADMPQSYSTSVDDSHAKNLNSQYNAVAKEPPIVILPLPVSTPRSSKPSPPDLLTEALAKPPLKKTSELNGPESAKGVRLPDLSDWIRHRAQQESLFLSPLSSSHLAPFAAVTASRSDGSAEATLSFDRDWAKMAYSKIARPSIESMLQGQNGHFGVEFRTLTSSIKRPLAPYEAILYIILSVPLLYGFLVSPPREKRTAPGSVSSHYETPAKLH